MVSTVDIEEKTRESIAENLDDEDYGKAEPESKDKDEKEVMRLLRQHTRAGVVFFRRLKGARIEVHTGFLDINGEIEEREQYHFSKKNGKWVLLEF